MSAEITDEGGTLPALWSKEDGFIDNLFVRVETLEEAGNRRALLPLAIWLEKIAHGEADICEGHGVFVAAGEEIEPLVPFLEKIAVIALNLPNYADGRAYSKAARLRQRYGYKGELRATGDVLIDQISNLLRAGFDRLEVTHPLTKKRLEQGDLLSFPGFYQPVLGLQVHAGRRIWR